MQNYNFVNKYNRQFNILLVMYCILCLVFALLFNGFFVNPKAYNGEFNVSVDMSLSGYNHNGTVGGSSTLNISGSSKFSKAIFYFGDDLKEYINTAVFTNDNLSCEEAFCLVTYD